MDFVRDFKKIDKNDADEAGGKGASLGEMTQAGIPVPPGFVILASTFDHFIRVAGLEADIDSILHKVNHQEIHTVEAAAEKIQALIKSAKMPADIAAQIKKSFKKMGAPYVAVRSSATAEDGAEAAWAGQLDSYLNTTDKTLLQNVQKCWASLFTPRAIFYRFEKSLHAQHISVAVVVQTMVQSEISGIAFSVHPVTQDYNQLIIEAGFGLGEAIVSGQITPDSYVVEKKPLAILDKAITVQDRGLFRAKPGRGPTNDWQRIKPIQGASQTLSDKQILELSRLVLKIEKHYDFPVDVEWAYQNKKFYIVQSRPITTLTQQPASQGLSTLKYLKDGDSWLLAEEIPNMDFQFPQIWLSSFVNNLEKTININYKKVICVYDGYNLKFYFGEKDSEVVSAEILRKIIDEGFGKIINLNIRRVADKLFKISRTITPEYLKKLDDKKLVVFYKKLDDVHTEFYEWCWLPNAVDMFHPHFTEHLKSILAKHVKTGAEINSALVALSFSEDKSFVQDEIESLLRLAIFKKNNPQNKSGFEKKLQQHYKNFFYLKHLWIGKDGVSTLREYRQAVNKILSEVDPQKKLRAEQETWHESKKLRDDYEREIKLKPAEKKIFREYAEFAFTKSYRRRAQLYWAYKMDLVFAELAKRLGISFMESRFLLPSEIYAGLEEGFSKQFKSIVGKRTEHCVYYGEKDLEIVTIDKDCKFFEDTIPAEATIEVKQFSGQVACTGNVRGVVKIVNTPSDMGKVNEGDVLVSIATNPDILPAMKKAVAFVTEQGGITSHAAIVAREMNKPCIIGTKIATRALKDGDLVEVDADNGIVRII